MAKKINLHFHLARSDIVKALRDYALRQPRNWIMMLLTGGGAVVLLGRLATTGQADEFTAWGFFAAVVFLAFTGWALLVNPWLEGRRFERSGLLTLERFWTVEDKGLHIRVQSPQGKSAETRFEWRQARRFYQTSDYYLLLEGGDKPSVHILPVRVFESDRQRKRFVQLATKRGKNK
jgi:hypothetical protein